MRQLREELNWCYSQLDAAELEGGAVERGLGRGAARARRATGSVHELRAPQPAARGEADQGHQPTAQPRPRLRLASTPTASRSTTVRAALPETRCCSSTTKRAAPMFAFVVGRDGVEVRAGQHVRARASPLGFLAVPALQAPARRGLRRGPSARRCWSPHGPICASSIEELIAPLLPLLDARSLVVVPHGPLHRVPFQALWDGETYLVDHFALSYAPSASVSPPLLDAARATHERRTDPGGPGRRTTRGSPPRPGGGVRDAGGARSPRRPGDAGRVARAGRRRST